MPILRMVFINRFIISAASLGVKTADTLWLQLFKKKNWKICHISLFYVILNRNIFGLKAVRQNNTITATSSWPLGNCVEGFLTTVWHFTTDGRNVSTDKGNGAELKVVLLVPAVECFELHRVEGRMWRVWQLFWKQSKKSLSLYAPVFFFKFIFLSAVTNLKRKAEHDTGLLRTS